MRKINIFISYKQDDSKWFVGRLSDAMKTHKKFTEMIHGNPFFDIEGIQPADVFPKKIEKAIEDCDLFLLVIGPNFLDKRKNKEYGRIPEYVAIELRCFLQKNNERGKNQIQKLLIPVMIDGVKMPKKENFPSDLKCIPDYNGTSFYFKQWENNLIDFSNKILHVRNEINVKKKRETKSFMPINKSTGVFTDPRDGQKYKARKHASIWWMTQNFNYEIDGSYLYDFKKGNEEEFGRLYIWDAVWEAIPDGWRLPTEQEWKDVLHPKGLKIKFKLGGMWHNGTTFRYIEEYGDYWSVENSGVGAGNARCIPFFIRINSSNEMEKSDNDVLTYHTARSLILVKDCD